MQVHTREVRLQHTKLRLPSALLSPGSVLTMQAFSACSWCNLRGPPSWGITSDWHACVGPQPEPDPASGAGVPSVRASRGVTRLIFQQLAQLSLQQGLEELFDDEAPRVEHGSRPGCPPGSGVRPGRTGTQRQHRQHAAGAQHADQLARCAQSCACAKASATMLAAVGAWPRGCCTEQVQAGPACTLPGWPGKEPSLRECMSAPGSPAHPGSGPSVKALAAASTCSECRVHKTL